MTQTELYEQLNFVNHTREKRNQMASLVLKNPTIVPLLLKIIAQYTNPLSCRAAWILEASIKQDLSLLYPNLNDFTSVLKNLTLAPAIRPMAKICEILIAAYYSKTPHESQNHLTNTQLEKITEACFDWLIGEHKVAAKAYSITTLVLLGTTFTWVHPALQSSLEDNYLAGSAAYKARAKAALKKLGRIRKKR